MDVYVVDCARLCGRHQGARHPWACVATIRA